jgi:hypothetical protein
VSTACPRCGATIDVGGKSPGNELACPGCAAPVAVWPERSVGDGLRSSELAHVEPVLGPPPSGRIRLRIDGVTTTIESRVHWVLTALAVLANVAMWGLLVIAIHATWKRHGTVTPAFLPLVGFGFFCAWVLSVCFRQRERLVIEPSRVVHTTGVGRFHRVRELPRDRGLVVEKRGDVDSEGNHACFLLLAATGSPPLTIGVDSRRHLDWLVEAVQQALRRAAP